MKTTIDIADELLLRAKRRARTAGVPLRSLVEEGLRRVLTDAPAAGAYRLPDRSIGDPRAANPLEAMTWPEVRDAIYGGR